MANHELILLRPQLNSLGGLFISLSYRVLHTTRIAPPGINNSKFNYFTVAEHDPFTIVLVGVASNGGQLCEGSRCENIRFCRIGYTDAGNKPTVFMSKFQISTLVLRE